MPRATPRFLAEVRRSHTVYSYCDVISPTNEIKRLPAVDGEVSVDRSAEYRRAARIDCIDPLGIFVPEGTSGILTPFGTEVRPYRGVEYADGTIEVYPLGVFRLARVTLTESSSSAANSGVRIALEMYDRSRTIARDKFTNVYTVPSGTNILTAIKLILGRTFADLEYDSITTPLATTAPQVYDTSDDPWQAVTKLAASIGCEIYFDTEGRVVIAPPTDIDALPAPDFTYIEGKRSTMMDLQSVFSDEPGFNGVIVTGESPGDEKPPVRAEAWDNEPSSPTYRLGPYGEVPMFITDSNVKTTADAQKMADSLLKQQIGFAAQLTITSWVNPTLEAGDVVEVQRPKMNVAGLYVVDSFNVPLRKDGAQRLGLRTKRQVS
jgi:hypothetical protein